MEWISVKKKLPEERVLTVDKYGHMVVAVYSKNYKEWIGADDVRWWMPLPPAPPKE